MNNVKGSEYEDKANRYLESVDDAYVYDKASGIYRQNTQRTRQKGEEKAAPHGSRMPLWINVQRDWLVISISILTLIGLSITVCIAHRQWSELNRQTKAAQWSQYTSCLNAQAAILSLRESQKSTQVAIASSKASIGQAASAVEAQRSIIAFATSMPNVEMQSTLAIPYMIRNEGKSMANHFQILSNAVLLKNGEKFVIRTRDLGRIEGTNFPAGSQSPPKEKQGDLIPLTALLLVRDVDGKSVASNSQEASKFISGTASGYPAVFVYGTITYSDFSGTYIDKFCYVKSVVHLGVSQVFDENRSVCGEHNSEHKKLSYGVAPDISTIDTPVTLPACKPPSE